MAFDGKFDVNRIDKNGKFFPKVLKNMFDTGNQVPYAPCHFFAHSSKNSSTSSLVFMPVSFSSGHE